MTMMLRGLVTLWALFFAMLALRGLVDPAVYGQQFGFPEMVEGARNTIRGDFTAFFLLSAGAALWGAWRRNQSAVLWIPTLLFGIALASRAVGVALGDGFGPVVRSSMIAEAASVLLLLVTMRALGPRRYEPLGQPLR